MQKFTRTNEHFLEVFKVNTTVTLSLHTLSPDVTDKTEMHILVSIKSEMVHKIKLTF